MGISFQAALLQRGIQFVLAGTVRNGFADRNSGREMRNVKDYVRDKGRALDRMGIVARWGEAMMKWE
jgi:hypothetical protein